MELVTPPVEEAANADANARPAPSQPPTPRGWIAIIEPNFSGHRWRYAEWIADACIEAGERCVVVTDQGYASHPFAQRIASRADPERLRIAAIDMHTLVPAPVRNHSVYARFHGLFTRAFAEISGEFPVRLVVVPYADYFFYTLGTFGSPFGSTDWIGLVMGASFHHSQMGVRTPPRFFVDATKRVLFTRSMRVQGLRKLLTIDPTLPDW
ncbi:MAG TPA: group 1 glycosyl transferase, partial [Paraburkholderia sp.]